MNLPLSVACCPSAPGRAVAGEPPGPAASRHCSAGSKHGAVLTTRSGQQPAEQNLRGEGRYEGRAAHPDGRDPEAQKQQ